MKELKSILLISHSSEKTGGGEDDFERLLKYLYGKYKLIGVLPKGERVENLSKYFNDYLIVDINIFPFSGFAGFKSYLAYFRRAYKVNKSIRKYIRGFKIDCAYINSSVNFLIVSALKKAKIPIILSIKEIIKPNFIRNLIFLYLKSRVSDFIVISKYLQRKVSKTINVKKINLIYSSIETGYIEYINKINLQNIKNEEVFTIVNIGAISKYKGQHVLLEAVKNIRDQKIVINFVGRITDKNYYSELVSTIAKMGSNIQVNFIGEVSKYAAFEYILRSTIVVVSSLEEGMSLVILEALNLRKIVISSNVGIAEEVIKNNENGFVYPSGDFRELSKYISFFITNNKNVSQFTNKSTNFLEDKFNLMKNLESIHQVFIRNICK